MTAGGTAVREADQWRALSRAFFARFFDNDWAGNGTDVRASFIWLMAAAAMPGLVMPHIAMFRWDLTMDSRAPLGRIVALRMNSGLDKTFILGVTMVVIGAITAAVWESILIDRRDLYVLGVLPMHRRTIVSSKLTALLLFIGVLSLGMHAGGAFFYAVYLGGHEGLVGMLRLGLVHLVTLFAAGLFAFLAVVSAQGLLLAIVGPRWFARFASVLQLALIVAVVLLLLVVPAVAFGGPRTLYYLTPERHPWTLRLPPAWFFGLYEVLLGRTYPPLHVLAGRALIALGSVTALTLITYPLAYRRLVASAMIGTPPQRVSLTKVFAARLASLVAWTPVGRATAQFTLATLGRVGTPRLLIAGAVGTAVALCLPIVASYIGAGLPARPTGALLAVPVVLMSFVLTALRVTFSLPSELAAAWMFDATAGRDWAAHRRATRHLMWALGVAPPILLTLPVYWQTWGAGVALAHAGFCTAVGVLVTEALMAGLDGVPGTRAYVPGRAKLQSRWPWYLFGASTVMVSFPGNEAYFLQHPYGLLGYAALLLWTALITRLVIERRLPAPGLTAEDEAEITRFDLHD